MDSSLSTQLAVSGSPYTDSATNTAALKETDSSATISAIATKLVDELKGSSNTISRPASTSSRNSVQSVTDTQSMQRKQADSQDSLSSMPTPRNTFLCPPTGINISYKGSLQSSSTSVTATSSPMPNWDSLQHQKQLQQLLEEKGLPQESTAGDDARTARMSFPASQWPIKASFDDSYCLLSAPKDLADGPSTREAAIDELVRLSNARPQRPPTQLTVPLALAQPIEALSQLEDALAGILARRHTPTRTRTQPLQKGGAGPAAAAASAGATGPGAPVASGQASRRRHRGSLASAGQDTGGADDKRSVKSRTSIISSEIASNTAPNATPYAEFNGHLERLTACISRLQTTQPGPAPEDSSAKQTSTAANAASSAPPSSSHLRHSSMDNLGASSALSGQRLPPVDEGPLADDSLDDSALARPRSSSHASMASGASSETRRRILVTEVPSSSRFPNLFGFSLNDISFADRALMYQSPNIAASSGPGSNRSESIHSKSSGNQKHQQGSSGAPAGHSASTKKSSRAAVSEAPVTVREITPASRQAVWLTVYSTAEGSKNTLWRRKQWHRRFAIFAGNVLYLFKSSSPPATALTRVRLTPTTIVCVNDSFPGRNWVVEITQSKNAAPGSPRTANPEDSQSWFLQTEQRGEMVNLLKELKGAVNELQTQPDMEKKEEERLKTRRRKQRKEAKQKSAVCPWEVDEFSDGGGGGSGAQSREYTDDSEAEGLADPQRQPQQQNMHGMVFDDDMLSSEDEEPLIDGSGANTGAGAMFLEAYSMSGNAQGSQQQQSKAQAHNYTGTGGIAEWGAHRLQLNYDPSLASAYGTAKSRSYSTDPSAVMGRRPSLADALVPPSSATQELTPIPPYNPNHSPTTSTQVTRPRGSANPYATLSRSSMASRVGSVADASALIDQMFASASRELSTPNSPSIHGGGLFVVREEEE